MTAAVTLASFVLSAPLIGQTMREPHTFLKERIGLTDDQIAAIDRGKAVSTALPTKAPAEIFIFGAVYVNAASGDYLKLARSLDHLRKLPNYLGLRKFSSPPELADLEGFTLEADDIRNLKYCRPGSCRLQLSAEAMQELRERANWSSPDAAVRVNEGVRQMALDTLLRYQKGGDRALPAYADRNHPVHVAEQLQSLLSRSEATPVYLPELNRYLLEYPHTKLKNIETMFYWEKVAFGLKPTLRLNHAIAYESTGPRGTGHIFAVKQLYASHYFELALDLTAAIPDSSRTDGKGFYLISLKGSTQQGLTGLTGSLLRRLIVSRTRSAQDNTLIGIKKTLEQQ